MPNYGIGAGFDNLAVCWHKGRHMLRRNIICCSNGYDRADNIWEALMTWPWLHSFCEWLRSTAISHTIQNTSWIIPATQTVHILAVALIFSSALMMDLRIFGLIDRRQSIATYMQRFLPPIWSTLPVLLATGTILTIGEPSRELENPSFQLKMVLLVLAMLSTSLLQRPAIGSSSRWDDTSKPTIAMKIIALASLCLWVAIIFAGRWIAYVNTGSD
jgi:hypothetical protein